MTKHVAIVLGSLNPGGAESQMVRKAIRLKARGWQVTIVLPNGAGDMPGNRTPWVEAAGIPMVSCVAWKDKCAGLKTVFDRLQPDVMDAVGYPATLWAAIGAYWAGVPKRIIRFESCGYVREEFPDGVKLEFEGHSAATAFVGNSQAVADSISLYNGVDGTPRYVIRNGVEFPAGPLQRPARSPLVIGNLGNFRADGLKNQRMLVRAAAWLVADGITDFKVELCGYDTEYRRDVESDIRALQVGKYVTIPGAIDDLDHLRSWDIAVNCSRTEGLSNAIQEGMAYGLPTVATAVGGNPELVEDGVTGLLVPDDDEHALAEALARLIQDADLRWQYGQAARDKMERECNWSTILDQWEALYEAG
jgi:glycosyltransferase involved in cell wall biosynthesis